MKAMVLNAAGRPLVEESRPDPLPGAGTLRIKVEACAICRTDLHVVDGELPGLHCPRIPGHEVVGRVDLVGTGVASELIGRRVGLGWLAHTCGYCDPLPLNWSTLKYDDVERLRFAASLIRICVPE
ncbi:MAG: alcohol dehydrogenase catalytic domain-containing protein [Bosea sp.]|nr:alcohol dehydrogenase catalytic domain-containing protein [Bosea sp. (in: a-proteobacteria)]